MHITDPIQLKIEVFENFGYRILKENINEAIKIINAAVVVEFKKELISKDLTFEKFLFDKKNFNDIFNKFFVDKKNYDFLKNFNASFQDSFLSDKIFIESLIPHLLEM